MMFITDNITILNQHNSLMCEKSCFKTSAVIFLILKNKQYIFKTDVINNINFIIINSIIQFIKIFVNVFLSNNLTMTISNSVICKLLKFK